MDVCKEINTINKIRKKDYIMAKIKQIGGNPKEIAYDAKDILIWMNA